MARRRVRGIRPMRALLRTDIPGPIYSSLLFLVLSLYMYVRTSRPQAAIVADRLVVLKLLLIAID